MPLAIKFFLGFETLKESGNAKIGEYLEKMMLDGYITEIMENEYSN